MKKAVHALHSLQQIYRMLGVRNDLVLVSRNGKVLSNAQLRRVLDRVLRKANIDKPFTFTSAVTYLCYADTESGRTDQRSQQVAWPCEYFDNIQHIHSRSLF